MNVEEWRTNLIFALDSLMERVMHKSLNLARLLEPFVKPKRLLTYAFLTFLD